MPDFTLVEALRSALANALAKDERVHQVVHRARRVDARGCDGAAAWLGHAGTVSQ